jgi:DNA-binding transcriptional LysR family regulator
VLGLTEAVEAGIGVGPLPCFIADDRPGLVRLAPPNPDFATGLWLLTHPDLRQSARVRVFLDFLAGEVAKQRRRLEGEAPRGAQGPMNAPTNPPSAASSTSS